MAYSGTMSFSETILHDLKAIRGFLVRLLVTLLKSVAQIFFYFILAGWFVLNVILEIAWLLTLRDATQWFLGTNRNHRR